MTNTNDVKRYALFEDLNDQDKVYFIQARISQDKHLREYEVKCREEHEKIDFLIQRGVNVTFISKTELTNTSEGMIIENVGGFPYSLELKFYESDDQIQDKINHCIKRYFEWLAFQDPSRRVLYNQLKERFKNQE